MLSSKTYRITLFCFTRWQMYSRRVNVIFLSGKMWKRRLLASSESTPASCSYLTSSVYIFNIKHPRTKRFLSHHLTLISMGKNWNFIYLYITRVLYNLCAINPSKPRSSVGRCMLQGYVIKKVSYAGCHFNINFQHTLSGKVITFLNFISWKFILNDITCKFVNCHINW